MLRWDLDQARVARAALGQSAVLRVTPDPSGGFVVATVDAGGRWSEAGGLVQLEAGGEPAPPGRPTPAARQTVARSPDGRREATLTEEGVRVHGPATGAGTAAWRAGASRPVGIAWAPDSAAIVVALEDGELARFDPRGRVSWRYNPLGAPVQALAWSPDGTRIAVTSAAGPALVLSAADGSELRRVSPGGLVAPIVAWATPGDRLALVDSRPGGGQGLIVVPSRPPRDAVTLLLELEALLADRSPGDPG